MNKENLPELLAPAGSLEAFFAAMEKGADAVYIGLRDFSARARAKNFTTGQVEKMAAYAHAEGKKLYVALNTLVKEHELPQLVDTLSMLDSVSIDAVILQDLAIARLISRHFPKIPLHASTQMTIHNSAGVKMLHELGFERAVLARELDIEEIASIVKATPVEIETFVHGALCFSISGQCFFSSCLGGHSGNRGRCAQPCRRLYNHRGKSGHYFSTSDLSVIDIIPELVQAGVKSLKIEGRMKSAEYVATVVEAYRMVLDAPAQLHQETLKAAKEILKYSFGRTPTKGFLTTQQPDDIANPWQKGGTGRYIGQIKSVKGNRLTFETRDALFVGDRIRVQPKTDMAGQAWTIRELFVNRKKVMESRAANIVEVETPFRFTVGDSVYKVSSREAFTLSENACLRRLESAKPARKLCRLKVAFNDGVIEIRAEVDGASYQYSHPIGDLEAARSSDMESVLRGQFSRSGETAFQLESLQAPDFPPLLIPSAIFKELRRKFYQYLEKQVDSSVNDKIAQSRLTALKELEKHSHGSLRQNGSELTISVDTPREWRFPFQNGADFTLLNLSKATIHQLASTIPKMKGYEDRIIWQLPFILFDKDIELYKATLRELYTAGFRRFEAANISHFHLLKEFSELHITTWYRCFSLNHQAMLAWQDLGAEAVTFYIEDDANNISELLETGIRIEKRMIAYTSLPVMTTKIKMKDVHSSTPLQSDRGEGYLVTTRDGLQTISSTTPISLTARHAELRRKGCSSFLLDLSQAPRESWNEIVAAFKSGRKIEGTTEFNYETGLV